MIDAAKPLRNIKAICAAPKPQKRALTEGLLELAPSGRLVLIVLVLRADNDTNATLARYPTTQRWIAKATGLARSTVELQLADLERREFIRIERRQHPRGRMKISSLYHLRLERLLPKPAIARRDPLAEAVAAAAIDRPESVSASRALLAQLNARR